jgi:hypothetical protein
MQARDASCTRTRKCTRSNVAHDSPDSVKCPDEHAKPPKFQTYDTGTHHTGTVKATHTPNSSDGNNSRHTKSHTHTHTHTHSQTNKHGKGQPRTKLKRQGHNSRHTKSHTHTHTHAQSKSRATKYRMYETGTQAESYEVTLTHTHTRTAKYTIHETGTQTHSQGQPSTK